MVEVVSLTIKKAEKGYRLSVVKDDTFETITEQTEDFNKELDKIFEHAKSIKTEEQRAIEENRNKNRELLTIINEKTTDEEKLKMLEVYEDWENYPIGYDFTSSMVGNLYLKYQNKLYRLNQAHKKQIDWAPRWAQALWVEVLPKGTIAEYGKNLDGSNRNLAVNPYKTGEQCIYKGKIYTWILSTPGLWSPKDYPRGWEYEREV